MKDMEKHKDVKKRVEEKTEDWQKKLLEDIQKDSKKRKSRPLVALMVALIAVLGGLGFTIDHELSNALVGLAGAVGVVLGVCCADNLGK